MSFKDKSFTERFKTMGDIAEDAFVQYGPPAVRWGQDKTPFDTYQWPEKLRYAPDFIGPNCFYEVQGCGRDQIIKFKHEKVAALMMWNFEFPVAFWLWDSQNERFIESPIKEVRRLCGVVLTKIFPEGKLYYDVPCSMLGEWTEIPKTATK